MKDEELANFIRILILQGCITFKDLLPIIKKGTSKMLDEPEEKLFNQKI